MTSLQSLLPFQGTKNILIEHLIFLKSLDLLGVSPQPISIPMTKLPIPRNTFYQESPLATLSSISGKKVSNQVTHSHDTLRRTRKNNRNQGTKHSHIKDKGYIYPQTRCLDASIKKKSIRTRTIGLYQSSAALTQEALRTET